MARPSKQGLDYFPFDTDFFMDEKIQLYYSQSNAEGIVILIKLWCKIYRNGFFIQWDENMAKVFAQYEGGIKLTHLQSLIQLACRYGIFDTQLLHEHRILTSVAIQRRFFSASIKKKQLNINNDYLLVSPQDYGIRKGIISGITPVNSEITPQRKEEDNKGKIEREYTSLKDFYSSELEMARSQSAKLTKEYQQITDFILGKNSLNIELVGLEFFLQQLSFDQFTLLFNKHCDNLSKYETGLMKIHEIDKYKSGKSLCVRLENWFLQDKDPESLFTGKPKKVYIP